MNDATERLNECRRRCFKRRSDLYRIHSGHRNKFSEAAGQSGDAVLAIKLTLMTVLSAAVLAKNLTPATNAIQSLIDNNSISFTQILNRVAHLLDDTGDFMSQDLRLQNKRYRLTVLIGVVVCVARKDVHVGAAKSHCRNSNQHFVRRNYRARDVSHLETPHVVQHASFHRLSIHFDRCQFFSVQPLCPLCLCGLRCQKANHRDTEDTEVAQRNPAKNLRDRSYQAARHHAAMQTFPLFRAYPLPAASTATRS